MVTNVDIEIARRDLNGLIAIVSSGGEVLISDGEKLVARLTGVIETSRQERVPGLHPDAISTSEDFDAPIPDEFWTSA